MAFLEIVGAYQWNDSIALDSIRCPRPRVDMLRRKFNENWHKPSKASSIQLSCCDPAWTRTENKLRRQQIVGAKYIQSDYEASRLGAPAALGLATVR